MQFRNDRNRAGSLAGIAGSAGIAARNVAAAALLGGLLSGGSLAMGATAEQERVNRATRVVERFLTMPETGIPERILRNAKGVAIISLVEGGFIWSGRAGEGVVLARTAGGWSGPSFIRVAGAGFGPQAGGKVTDLVVILNTREAVRAFARGGNIELGGSLSAAAGPVGRTAETGLLPVAAVYTYSRSKGLFAGASLEGMVIMTNQLANARYYGRSVSARAILNNQVAPPRGARPAAGGALRGHGAVSQPRPLCGYIGPICRPIRHTGAAHDSGFNYPARGDRKSH